MKTLKEKIAVMQAASDGKPIEFCHDNGSWTPIRDTDDARWDWACYDYRVAETPITVDWSAIRDDIVAVIVRASDEELVGLRDAPAFDIYTESWIPTSGYRYDMSCLKSVERGTVTGRDAIAWRPGYRLPNGYIADRLD